MILRAHALFISLLLAPVWTYAEPPVAEISDSSHAPALAPWPVALKLGAIAGCKASIIDHAQTDYLAEHHLTTLPDGFREKIALFMAPLIAKCDCLFDHVEQQQSYAQFIANESDIPSETIKACLSTDSR